LTHTPRVIRRLSSLEIDAFNQGLHNKRPKFIGKRRVPASATSCHLDSFGNCIVDADADGGGGLNKRSPRRKFMGKKSDTDAAAVDDVDDMIQRTIRGRKFVGKRSARKFLGRRAAPSDDREDLFTRLSREINSEIRSYLDKRARRKFVG